MTDIKEGLQYVLQTRNDFTLAVHGTATAGCHAVLDNLIEEGDKVLALINGYWGELMANMSERLGAQVVRFNRAPGTVFTLDEIENALRVHRPDIVLVVQGESSTTVRQPLEGVGDLCEKYDFLKKFWHFMLYITMHTAYFNDNLMDDPSGTEPYW